MTNLILIDLKYTAMMAGPDNNNKQKEKNFAQDKQEKKQTYEKPKSKSPAQSTS